MATQLFAAEGVCTSVTVTPACGLLTLNAKPEIVVVPGVSRAAIECEVSLFAVPLHARSSEAAVQLLAAPGNSGACVAAIAADTAIPLIVVGAFCVQLHVAGQFAVPLIFTFPVVPTPSATPGTLAIHVMLI